MAGEDALFQRFGREFKRGEVLFREGEPGTDLGPLLDAPSSSVSIRQKLTEFAEAEGLSL